MIVSQKIEIYTLFETLSIFHVSLNLDSREKLGAIKKRFF